MEKRSAAPQTIDEYIRGVPSDVQDILRTVRATIRRSAPKAVEKISYQIPAFSLEGDLVYFAAFKKHIGFFPTASGVAAFKRELSVYKGSKGSVRFPLDKPLPLALIGRIVKYRVRENLRKAEAKRRTDVRKTGRTNASQGGAKGHP